MGKSLATHHQKLLTSDVARLAGMSADWVRDQERAGKLKATKTPTGTRLYDLGDVAKLIAARQAHKDAEAIGDASTTVSRGGRR
jgi:hypothetical protein